MTDLDAMRRDQLPEPSSTLAAVLDEWLHRAHGVTSSGHHVGLLLDLLAEQGLTVTRTDALWRARNMTNGRCRACGARITGPDDGPKHRMSCRHYVGAVTHSWIKTGVNGTFGTPEYFCSCGRSVRTEWGDPIIPVCPDAGKDWQGERP